MAQARKVIAVTGVTSGLGAAMTQFFSRNSHLVVGCGRTNLKIEELNSKYGGNRFHVVDVSKNNEVEHWVRQITADFGVPDILINNASITNKTSKFWRVPPEDFDNAIDININAVDIVPAPDLITFSLFIRHACASTIGACTHSDACAYFRKQFWR